MKNSICFWICLSISVTFVLGNDDERALERIQQRFWDSTMKRFPVYSTHAGLYKYNDQVDSGSWREFEKAKDDAEMHFRQLQQLSTSSMSQKHQDDYLIFSDTLSTFINGFKWSSYGPMTPINFLGGIQTAPEDFPNHTPFNTRGDFENYVARLKKLPTYYDEITERLREAVRVKHTYHNVSMLPVSAQFDKMLNGTEEDFAFYKPLKNKLDNKTDILDVDKQRLRTEAVAAITEIKESLKRLQDYINQVYIQNTRPTLGIYGLENGKELYKDLLKFYTSLDVTPEYVHQKGLDEVERIVGNMQKIMTKQGHMGSVKEYFDKLKNDSRFFFNTSEEVIAEFKSIIEHRINPKLNLLFKDFPDLPLEVRPSPSDGPMGYYSLGSEDGSTPGIFYLNAFRPAKMIKIDFMALSLHEANPGHHYQLSIAATADIPSYRRKMPGSLSNAPFEYQFYSAFLEGWALYSELLGEELDIYKDDYELMGRYGSEIFRACRLVVDTGIHYYNWTREKSVEYMQNYTAFNEAQLKVEIDRYSTWPGQACAYKIGELKIVELRNKAKVELGELFDIKDFHSTVLRNGGIPLTLLEDVVHRWIASVKSTQTSNSVNEASQIASSLAIVFTLFFRTLIFA